jgi:hypothetical protein
VGMRQLGRHTRHEGLHERDGVVFASCACVELGEVERGLGARGVDGQRAREGGYSLFSEERI